jgi:Fe-S-cluster-containing hydrogenase component 2
LLALICGLALLAAIRGTPFVDATQCVGCGICAKVCPTGAISLEGQRAGIDAGKCINCGFCLKNCPYGAIRSPQ